MGFKPRVQAVPKIVVPERTMGEALAIAESVVAKVRFPGTAPIKVSIEVQRHSTANFGQIFLYGKHTALDRDGKYNLLQVGVGRLVPDHKVADLENAVLNTCLDIVKELYTHECLEFFHYDNKRIFDPHKPVEGLVIL